MIGFAMCGSFCNIEKSLKQLTKLVDLGYEVQPFMSEMLYSTSTRFGKSEEINRRVEELCGRRIIHSIPDAEPYGPSKPLECLIISPCTGNTLAKLASGITDTTVCMVTKAHLRNDRPVLIALATNDALSANLKNIADLKLRKNVYFVPMIQDDPINKPHSLSAEFKMLPEALEKALRGEQIGKLFVN